MAEAPNLRVLVEEIDRTFPHLLRTNSHETCAEFEQRFIHAANGSPDADGPWGFTAKADGENGYTWSNGVRTSHDAVSWLPAGRPQSERRQVDIIRAGGAHPAIGGPDWRPVDPSEYRSHNIWLSPRGFPVLNAQGGGGSTEKCRLGFGFFPLVRAMIDWPADARANLAYIETHLNPDYYRVMLFIEGAKHGNPDPWLRAGIGPDHPRWAEGYHAALDLLASYGKKMHVTLLGGVNFDWLRCADLFISATAGRWQQIEGVEVANEFRVNGFSPQNVTAIGWHLRARLPGHIPLALSSPHSAHNPESDNNELMGESFDELYGGNCPANEITVHLARNTELEPIKWGDPFNFNMFYPEKPKTSGEPRGYGASAGGDIRDPAIFKADYERTDAAGWKRYTGHARWCVFNGRIDPPHSANYHEQNVWDHPGIEAIFHALREARHGASGQPSQPTTGNFIEWLKPGNRLLPDRYVASADGRYKLLFQLDGNLVLYGPDGAIWNSQTQNAEPMEVAMQSDGNAVLYVKAEDGSGKAVWNSRTQGHDGASLLVQNDGNVIVVDAAGAAVRSILDDGGRL